MNNQQIAQLQMAQLIDEASLRRTAELYAKGADRRDKAVWAEVVTEDCVVEGPGFKMEGRAAIVGSLDILASMFHTTQHRVHNQVVTITGDTAHGETYSTADHLKTEGGKTTLLAWAIRYQDTWRRAEGVWRFSSRKLVIDWEETRVIG